jgi:hypothetical protein
VKRTVLIVVASLALLASVGHAQKTLRFGIPVDPSTSTPPR